MQKLLMIPTAGIRESLRDTRGHRGEVLAQTVSDAGSRVIKERLRFSGAESLNRSVFVDVRRKAADIHCRQGWSGKALSAATRAILARPIAPGRPVKCAFARLTTVLKD
jgi:hypothetical protein